MPLFRILVAVVTVTQSLAALAAVSPDEVRKEFRAAYDGALQSTPPADVADSEALRGYVLYPYVEAVRIEQQLEIGGQVVAPEIDARAAAFLARFGEEPVARRLRRSWLESLADRSRWNELIAEYRPQVATATLHCQYLAGQIALSRTATVPEQIVERWLTSQQLPGACEPVFQWARDRQIITAELIERRARLVLEEGNFRFARLLAAQLPAVRAEPLRQWADLLEQPRNVIDRLIAQPATPIELKALRAGWLRLARQDVDAAVARYDALVKARKLDAAAASQFAIAPALVLSWNRRPEALDFFAKVQPADFDDASLEWYARAALWNEDWPRVRQAVAAMSAAQRQSPAWQYWLARAAEQLGDRELAASLYESVLTADNFYAAMAAARLDRKISPHPQSLPLDEATVERLDALPAFARSRELKVLGLHAEALEEWQYGYRTLSATAKLQAIHLAARWQWFDQAIATATDNKVFTDYELLYPLPYDSEVKAAAKLADLAPEIVYSVLRQESLYRADAVSGVGARGLLQLMPSTARLTAKKWTLQRPSDRDLFTPAVNVRLGAAHLRDLLLRFDGQMPVALAGYNAGPEAAQRWLPATPIDVDRWVENIPFNETRGYVRRVLWHSIVFAWRREQRAQDVSQWLAQVVEGGAPGRVAEEAN